LTSTRLGYDVAPESALGSTRSTSPERLGVVVEPCRAEHRHEFVVLVGEAFDFVIRVVDTGGEEGSVVVADRGEVAVVARAAGDEDARAGLDGGGVFF
jgi:hypothetical protein